MINLSNILSFMRLPLAFFFLSASPWLRVAAVSLAMVTDCLDGHIARKSNSTTRLGAILDPAMDKFFVYFALAILLLEQKMDSWQAISMLSRDIFLAIFAIYLISVNALKGYEYKAIRWGKVSTALQFITLIAISLGLTVRPEIYVLFVLLGALAFLELITKASKQRRL